MKTPIEFKNEFNLGWNNIMSDMAPGLDDYEISMYLTQSQEEIVHQLYSGSGDFIGFEANEKVRRNLANLLHTTSVNTASLSPEHINSFLSYSIGLDENLMYLISERIKIQNPECCGNSKEVNVAPVKYDELNKVLENPFRRPSNRRVLRLDVNTHNVKIISKYLVSEYVYSWLQKPAPIIVNNLPAGFSIDGVSTAQISALDESLHRPIVKYAVQLAAANWASNNKN